MKSGRKHAQPLDSLAERVHQRAGERPEGLAYAFLSEGAGEVRLSYAELEERVRCIGALLAEHCAPGERALLLYPSGLDFIAAFLGCLYAGVVAVPAYPPRNERHMPRVHAMARDCGATLVLSTQAMAPRIGEWLEKAPDMGIARVLATDVRGGVPPPWSPAPAQSLAFLQYTSGSTAEPRGVMVGHAHILHNSECIRQHMGLSEKSVSVSWLPVFHDMGLIDGVVQPLYSGFSGYLLAPTAFLQQPYRWLEAISRHRGTHCGGPNFGYELCVQRVTPEQREKLDLSCWTNAYNGAEFVRRDTLERFARTFASCGFKSRSFYPCYGLAEATLIVSGGGLEDEPVVATVDSGALERHRVEEARDEARYLVGCGRAVLDTRIEIVDGESGRICSEREIGEVWVRGPGVATGYWGREEESRQVFGAHLESGEGPFMRTGDLGFMRAGELFVTGRLKELVIIRGRNLYPQDIERVVWQAHADLQADAGSAFSVEGRGGEELVVVQEVQRRALKRLDAEEVLRTMYGAVVEEFEIEPCDLVLVRPMSVPKTSSGKIQRRTCRQAYLADELEVVASWRALFAEPESPSRLRPGAGAQEVEAWLEDHFTTLLRLRKGEVDAGRPISDYVWDSYAIVEFAQRISSELGISLSLGQVLENTLKGLAGELAVRAPAVRAEKVTSNGLVVGPVPLTPSQHRFLVERKTPDPHHWNGSVLLELRRPVPAAHVERALEILVSHHDALRMRFQRRDGVWQQRLVGQDGTLSCTHFDFSQRPPGEQKAALEEAAGALQPTLDLERGPVARFAYFDLGGGRARLLLIIHHLLIDNIAAAILLEDLQSLLVQMERGQEPHLPPKTSSFKQWSEALVALAQTPELRAEAEYWTSLPWDAVSLLPDDFRRGANTNGSGRVVQAALSQEESEALVDLLKGRHTHIEEALLAGLARIWPAWTGGTTLLVDRMGYGRVKIAEHINVSRTVGDLSSYNPIVIDASKVSGRPMAALEAVERQYRQIRRGGIGFDVLRCLSQDQDLRQRLGGLPRANVSFNYVGPLLGEPFPQVDLLRLAPEAVGSYNSPRGLRVYPLALKLGFDGGQLKVLCVYSKNRHRRRTIERLAQEYVEALRQLVADSA